MINLINAGFIEIILVAGGIDFHHTPVKFVKILIEFFDLLFVKDSSSDRNFCLSTVFLKTQRSNIETMHQLYTHLHVFLTFHFSLR